MLPLRLSLPWLLRSRLRVLPLLCRGFTLIELMVTLAVLAMLLLATVPLAADWIHSAQTRDAHGKLVRSYGTTKALALRNPLGAPAGTVAAGLRLEMDGAVVRLLVCLGDPANASSCTPGHTRVRATANYPATVSTALNGTTLASGVALVVALDNRGALLLPASTAYTLTRGGSQNNETGTLQ